MIITTPTSQNFKKHKYSKKNKEIIEQQNGAVKKIFRFNRKN